MKKVKKEVSISLDSVSMERIDSCFGNESSRYTYEMSSRTHVPNIETLEFFVEVEEAETLKEFRELKNITKVELIDWLNKNYK